MATNELPSQRELRSMIAVAIVLGVLFASALLVFWSDADSWRRDAIEEYGAISQEVLDTAGDNKQLLLKTKKEIKSINTRLEKLTKEVESPE